LKKRGKVSLIDNRPTPLGKDPKENLTAEKKRKRQSPATHRKDVGCYRKTRWKNRKRSLQKERKKRRLLS